MLFLFVKIYHYVNTLCLFCIFIYMYLQGVFYYLLTVAKERQWQVFSLIWMASGLMRTESCWYKMWIMNKKVISSAFNNSCDSVELWCAVENCHLHVWRWKSAVNSFQNLHVPCKQCCYGLLFTNVNKISNNTVIIFLCYIFDLVSLWLMQNYSLNLHMYVYASVISYLFWRSFDQLLNNTSVFNRVSKNQTKPPTYQLDYSATEVQPKPK